MTYTRNFDEMSCVRGHRKSVFLTVLTVLTLLSIYLNYQGNSKSDQNKSVAHVELALPSAVGVISDTGTSANTTLPIAKNLNIDTQIIEWPRDQMWGCYAPPSRRTLLFGRKLRPPSTLDRLQCRKRVPDALVVGVKKCGSQTLTGFMDLHPEIVGQYETADRYNQCCVVRNRTKWIQYSPYSTAGEKTLVDVIKVADCVGRVKWILEEINPAMKFIVILRDPCKRAVSDYKHLRQAEKSKERIPLLTNKDITVIGEDGETHREHVKVYEGYNIPTKFEYAILDANSGNISDGNLYISKGIYVNFMKQLLDTVSRHNILVLDGDVFAKDPFSVVKTVESFLGVTSFFKREDFRKNSKGYFCPVIKQRPDSGCLAFKGTGHDPKVSRSIQAKMKAFYRPYNQELEALLQQKFKWSY